jgi:hypothetical protein
MKTYIIESARKSQVAHNEYELYDQIFVKIQDPLPKEIDIKKVLIDVEKAIPKNLVDDVETVYVGRFKPLVDRNVQSMYVGGAILISPDHKSEKELFVTFIHEFAHAIEEKLSDFIYGDMSLENEFLGKRKSLYYLLRDDYKIYKTDFLNPEYTEGFDSLIAQEIGYDNLRMLTANLFVSPYGCTSLREYFANCFEHYFVSGPKEISELSPAVYKKITAILSKVRK